MNGISKHMAKVLCKAIIGFIIFIVLLYLALWVYTIKYGVKLL
jgi:hypothetical protein